MEIRSLNTLRGLAALIVVVSHFSNTSGLWGRLLGDGAGQIGVMIFFLLSGFLMTHLYWHKAPTPKNRLSYVVSRFARVIPLYLAVVLFSFLTPYAFNVGDVGALLSHLLFLHGDSVLWTIPAEIQFYIIFGIAWLLLSKRGAAMQLVIALIFVATVFLGFTSETYQSHGMYLTTSIIEAIPYFTLGCLLGGLYKYRMVFTRYQSHFYLAALVVIPVLYPNIFIALFGYKHGMWKDAGVLAVLGSLFFAIVFLVPDGNRCMENTIGDFYGKISYSLYLLHLPVLMLLTYLGWMERGVLSLALFIVVASCVAWLSFKIVEAPSRRAIKAIVVQHA
jgi:peptidoglycan/LPS O-acetylase OafA/YrhL